MSTEKLNLSEDRKEAVAEAVVEISQTLKNDYPPAEHRLILANTDSALEIHYTHSVLEAHRLVTEAEEAKAAALKDYKDFTGQDFVFEADTN